MWPHVVALFFYAKADGAISGFRTKEETRRLGSLDSDLLSVPRARNDEYPRCSLLRRAWAEDPRDG